MSDFINYLRDYLSHYSNREIVDMSYKKLLLPSQFSKYVPAEDYIKYSILSIFDNKKNIPQRGIDSSYDGIIEPDEFASVSQEEYEKQIKMMQESYEASFGHEIKYHIPTYKELENMLKNDSPYEKECGTHKIQLKEICEPIKPDGEIGQSNQALLGECYQNVSNFALSYTEKGRKLLKKSIQIQGDKYQVTLYGAQPKPMTYEITQSELKAAQDSYVEKNGKKVKKYSYGDADIILLDLTIERYRKSINYRLRNRDTKAVKGFDDYLSGGLVSKNLALITGHLPYRAIYSNDNYFISASLTQRARFKLNTEKKQKKVENLLDYLARVGNENIAAGCTFKCVDKNWGVFGQKYDMHENHAYAIKKIDDRNDTITICNPWHGKNADIIVPFADFIKYVDSIQYIKL